MDMRLYYAFSAIDTVYPDNRIYRLFCPHDGGEQWYFRSAGKLELRLSCTTTYCVVYGTFGYTNLVLLQTNLSGIPAERVAYDEGL